MKFIVNIESPTATVNLPKTHPNGGEWTKIKLVKAIYNQKSATTNRILMFNIDECENEGYFETSGGAIIRYVFSYLITDNADVDEYRLYNQPYEHFKNTKTDKLSFKVYDVTGATSASDITSTYYVILEFDLQ